MRDRSPFRYPPKGGPHDHDQVAVCPGCETFMVLRQVEGFHETLDVSEHSRERVVAAVEAAALRGFVMGLRLVRADGWATRTAFGWCCAECVAELPGRGNWWNQRGAKP